MSKTIKIFSLIILFTLTQITLGQELTTSQQNELKSKVKLAAQNTKTIVSDFKQVKHMEVMESDIPSNGKLVFKSPNLIRWEYVTPYKSTVVFKEDKLFVSQDGRKDAYDLSSNKMFRSLNSLIVGSLNGDMFDNSKFEITYFTDAVGYRVVFVPKEKKILKFIGSFQLKFDKEKGEVLEVKLNEPNGDYTRITFQNKKLNSAVSEQEFKL